MAHPKRFERVAPTSPGIADPMSPDRPADPRSLRPDSGACLTRVRSGTAPIPPEARPKRTIRGFFSFNDPDGDAWLVQEVTTQLPGRI